MAVQRGSSSSRVIGRATDLSRAATCGSRPAWRPPAGSGRSPGSPAGRTGRCAASVIMSTMTFAASTPETSRAPWCTRAAAPCPRPCPCRGFRPAWRPRGLRRRRARSASRCRSAPTLIWRARLVEHGVAGRVGEHSRGGGGELPVARVAHALRGLHGEEAGALRARSRAVRPFPGSRRASCRCRSCRAPRPRRPSPTAAPPSVFASSTAPKLCCGVRSAL